MKIYKPDNTLFAEILASDNSYRYRSMMGDNTITLYFSLFEHREIPVGSYCDFEGERYTLMRPQNVSIEPPCFVESGMKHLRRTWGWGSRSSASLSRSDISPR